MKLEEIVSWYQKKIGTYDKEPWEKTVEEKILDGFSSVTLKTAKLKTELIDVDLVRGSTFPKAKPKQSLFTVIRLAILRYLFLPIYAQWWVRQTSAKAFLLMLTIYITQMINWAIYSFNINRSLLLSSSLSPMHCNDVQECLSANDVNISKSWKKPTFSTSSTIKIKQEDVIEHFVFLSDLLIPMTLGLLLSFIHSQIVATNIAQSGSKSTKRRRCSNPNNQNGRQKEGRLRRRKKLVRQRNQDCSESNLTTQSLMSQRRTLTNSKNKNYKINNQEDVESFECQIKPQEDETMYDREMCTEGAALAFNSNKNYESPSLGRSLRRRSVNWHLPIDNCAGSNIGINKDLNNAEQTQDKQQQTSPQSECKINTSVTATTSSSSSVGDGGSSSNTASPQKTVRIDDCVQEFYEDLIQRTIDVDYIEGNQSVPIDPLRLIIPGDAGGVVVVGEDDGFESLNGKSSSGEEANHSSVNPKNPRLLRCNNNNNKNDGQQQQRRREDLNSEHISSYHRLLNSSNLSSDETEEEGDEGEIVSNLPSPLSTTANYNECTTSATEWLGITTNSDECSYSSDLDNSDNYKGHKSDDQYYDMDFTPATLLNPAGISDRISCTIWDQREFKKAQMSVLEISSRIIENVESMPETNDYVYMGILFSLILSLIPCSCRLIEAIFNNDQNEDISYFDIPILLWKKATFSFGTILKFAFGQKHWERTVLILGFMQRLGLTSTFFMVLAVAERTFKQRFLYAKLFSHLTSSRRARKSNLPHFRLNKVRNIKTWLSVRSYLKKRGPQRSVDVIVSAAFMLTLFLLGFLSVEWLKDSVQLHSHLNMEALLWSATIGVFVLRYMTLGNKIHHKYRSVSVLITEQINLYLQIEKKPKKKDELMVSNSVLKLAADLLKELETPFKISGLSANPYLFTTIKVFILSALSGVLSEMLGFKLKLHKIKIK